MNLYHYSIEPYSSLLTRRQLGLSGPAGVKVSEDYLDHISFFTGPIPSKLIPSIFDEGHPFWQKGKVLYEHVVDVNTLPDIIRFEVVESVRKTELLDKFSEDNDWESDDPAILIKWRKLFNEKQKLWGEVGKTKKELVKALGDIDKGLSFYFLAAKKRDDFKDGYNKYAANVPHVMLYPSTGIIEVTETYKLTLGSDVRGPVVI